MEELLLQKQHGSLLVSRSVCITSKADSRSISNPINTINVSTKIVFAGTNIRFHQQEHCFQPLSIQSLNLINHFSVTYIFLIPLKNTILFPLVDKVEKNAFICVENSFTGTSMCLNQLEVWRINGTFYLTFNKYNRATS